MHAGQQFVPLLGLPLSDAKEAVPAGP
jgi:hypothetical protein